MIELDKDEKDLLAELTTHGGWRVYQKLLHDLKDDVLNNFKGSSIDSQKDLIKMAKEQARLELIENVIIPLVKDELAEET